MRLQFPRRNQQSLPRRHRHFGLVLLYHRVAEPSLDPQLLSVSPAHFAEHLDVLASMLRVVPLSAIAAGGTDRLRESELAAITFDDGYSDNLLAEPLLARHSMCATVFVTSGYLSRSPWPATLEYLVLRSDALPRLLELDIHGQKHRWALENAPLSPNGWTVLDVDDNPSDRHKLYRELSSSLRLLPGAEREEVLADLARQVVPASAAPPRLLSEEDLLQLVAGEVIDVGAHTHTHSVLAALRPDEQRREIAESKQLLETVTGRPVTSFAYPYGSPDDYTGETMEFVREAGFKLACANVPELVQRGCDRFEIPRFLVRDWDGEEFERRLRGWIDRHRPDRLGLGRVRAAASRLDRRRSPTPSATSAGSRQ